MHRLAETEPRLTLDLYEADTEEALDRLLRDDTDLVIGLDGDVRVDDPRFARRPLLVDPMDVALPPTTRSRVSRSNSPTWPTWTGSCRRTGCAWRSPCGNARWPASRLARLHVADSYDAVFALVRAGLGVALVPRMCAWDPGPDMVVRAPGPAAAPAGRPVRPPRR